MAKKRSTRGDALLLTRATVIRSAVQLLTPLVLVRLLDQSQFGEYRIFWLVANTATLILPLGMARSLLYFIPKATTDERPEIISQTMVYFLGVGIVACLLLLFGRFWLPETISGLTDPRWILAAFTLLWVTSNPVYFLANADQNIIWQSRAIIAIALLRALAVVGTAWFFRDLQAIFISLLVWTTLQFAIMIYYIASQVGWHLPFPTIRGLYSQLAFAVPFGFAQTLSGARRQIEQWIVTFLFSASSLAIFTIGVSFNAILHLVRDALGSVLLPKISRSHAAGDIDRAQELNSRGNVAIFALIAPTVIWIWVLSGPIVSILYTDSYLPAVPILRVYLLTILAMSIEVGTILMVLKQGPFVAKLSGFILIGASILSYAGGVAIGLVGVALGSLFGEIIGRMINFYRASKLLNVQFRHLQDWATLGKILAAGLVSGVVTAMLTAYLFSEDELVPRIAIGTPAFGAIYAFVMWSFGLTWLLHVFIGKTRWTSN